MPEQIAELQKQFQIREIGFVQADALHKKFNFLKQMPRRQIPDDNDEQQIDQISQEAAQRACRLKAHPFNQVFREINDIADDIPNFFFFHGITYPK